MRPSVLCVVYFVGTRAWLRGWAGPCGQYCSNKKNDKIQKLIHRIERRHSRLVARLTLVLAVELFEHAWVGTQVTFWQQVSCQPRVQLLPQGFLVRTLYLG